MLQDILTQIENIDEAIRWFKQNEPGQYEQRFFQLVTERSRLRRMATAEDENPAIAAYGESQKGKSYVMSNLLQKDGRPFTVEADGREYNFIEEINPPTTNTEATGVVTRFSSFQRHPERYRADHPVYVKLLSVTDLVAILCDGYFNDLHDFLTMSEEELRKLGTTLLEQYEARPDVQSFIIEDDVVDLQEYISKYIPAKAATIIHSGYLAQVAQIIRKVPANEWISLFAPLWNNNEDLTGLLSRLLAALQRLDYQREAYLDIDAVLNNNNTIMAVVCLLGLNRPAAPGSAAEHPNHYTHVHFTDQAGVLRTADRFEKHLLSAITKEVVFKINDRFLESEGKYCFDMVTPEVANLLPRQAVKKDILRHNDLLDFPGARPRQALLTSMIRQELSYILLRGKVAFLFNKYCETMSINILLFCHDHQNASVSLMYKTINDWVSEFVGETPEKRARRISDMGVSPFFYIATKFNIDMAQKSNSALNRPECFNLRWNDRLNKIIYNECFKADSVSWFNNWDAPHATFKNSYLLRDYKYSSNTGDGNSLYAGYTAEGGREEECLIRDVVVDGQSIDLYERLRTSFVTNENVRKFFSNPAKSWDVAATKNNDGSLHIIEQLSIVAANMGRARKNIFADNLRDTKRRLLTILAEYYHDDDADKRFEENLRKGYRIARELDFTYNKDNYFFGHLIQALQVTEKEMYQTLHTFISSGELSQTLHDSHEYEFIRRTCNNFADCATEEDKWDCLTLNYGYLDRAEAEEDMKARGVDVHQLFNSSSHPKLNSVYIADNIFRSWKKHLFSLDLMEQLTGEGGFSSAVMTTLLKNIAATAEELGIRERVERLIAPYVNVMSIATVNISFLADLIATEFNNYIADLGYHYRLPEEEERFRALALQRHLSLYRYIGAPRKADYNEAELTGLFHSLTDNPRAIPLAVEQNYYKWKEYMIISFIARTEPGDYDHEANQEIKRIIDKLS